MKNRTPRPGEVWYATLPKEENPNDLMPNRPCIIVTQENDEYLVIKVTTTNPRPNDPYDTPIEYWGHCGLKRPSTARASKLIMLPEDQIDNYKGRLAPSDEQKISERIEAFLNSM
ncbi:type II toxin-antitoxin system PemK/MazF family toxin [Bacillus subtilis]|uniref:type II toxin-antitoxin system PemK/MazF family toxin n=1 Tax=Bacillus subtilis TaxID=1423 RepID=UPI001E344C4B|nr:type II toxin-antitoxin system PemK/MazF family toxin [Bacillus subtilis]MCT6511971.1 type II toxin-antitoxin system PemK/MazF family toxin [Bacillus subtilis]MCX4078189.1 type II toxin-antitoxin system PemK/MazF family toxin [Bacillus subtilis]MDK7656575.1 type II toxin-antitoxin system PemK/MazF family toxin [Bacillus subtilis]MEC0433172.1 type II toxin-antitoxin system PemK/MazF family toxin [Bacillus subtilis]WRU05125.1 type II toxin-antitoxin system PemK/MazF family toxin [Bacillus sub